MKWREHDPSRPTCVDGSHGNDRGAESLPTGQPFRQDAYRIMLGVGNRSGRIIGASGECGAYAGLGRVMDHPDGTPAYEGYLERTVVCRPPFYTVEERYEMLLTPRAFEVNERSKSICRDAVWLSASNSTLSRSRACSRC